MTKSVTLIVAYGPDGALGYHGGLPWPRHTEDMRRFKQATLGKSVIMGRNTFESLKGPLPFRQNIVITNRAGSVHGDVDTAKSFEQALAKAMDGECFVIGGAAIYNLALPHADRVLLTEMKNQYEADVYFKIPYIHHWAEVSRERWTGEGEPCDFVELKML